MASISRRQFLQTSLALAAAGTVPLSALQAQTKGPASDQLRVAVVGVRGRGKDLVQGFAGKHNCVVTTICDADSAVIDKAMKIAEAEQGKPAKFEKDIRKLLEDKSIDVIAIATPNHWHALASIWAMQAGKDVYVEKPVSHNVLEGRRMVETARKHKRICQTGTQMRSMPGTRQAMEFLHAGKIGKIKLCHCICYKIRKSIGKADKPLAIPDTADFDLWCGPAPKKPLMRTRFHFDWHWIWDTGNGEIGNQGPHNMDIARWGLKKDRLPDTVLSVGGRLGYEDDAQTPNTQLALLQYADGGDILFDVRGLPAKNPYPGEQLKDIDTNHPMFKKGDFVGNIFHGTEGVLVIPRYTGGIAFSLKGEVLAQFEGAGDHILNFVNAVRSRKHQDLTADIEEGHLSSAMSHLANISYRLGKPESLGSGDGRKQFNHADANALLAKVADHLKDNMIDLVKAPWHLGRTLKIDPKTERFINDKEADGMLTREYRKGFEVPEKV